MKSYFLGIMAGATCVMALLWGGVTIAEWAWPHRIPPPAISGYAAFDEKLRFVRERPREPVDVLAVGSSMTWMQLDGEPIVRHGGSVLNAGTGVVQINQIRRLTQFFRRFHPEAKTILMMTALPDYEDCSQHERVVFDQEDAFLYASKEYPLAYFYMRYFVPLRYASQFVRRHTHQKPFSATGFWMDKHGATPVIHPVDGDYDLRYTEQTIDATCLDELEKFAQELAMEGLSFVVVLTPVNPRFKAVYPQTDAAVAQIISRIETLNVPWANFYGDPDYERSDNFWDAFHLQWTVAQRLSEEVAKFVSTVTQEKHAASLDAKSR